MFSWKSLRKRSERDTDNAVVSEALLDRANDIALGDEISRRRGIATTLARDELFRGALQRGVDAAVKNLNFRAYQPRKRKPTQRVLNLLWSDLHFGSMLDPREVPCKYGRVEEARRLAALCVQAAEYKRDHRDETTLALNLIGDVIQNQLHDPRDGDTMAEQWTDALHLLSQGIGFLGTQFKEVVVRTSTGNHGRNTARHKSRATHQKWDSLESLLYFSLSRVFDKSPNVSVELDRRPYYLYDNFGAKIFCTHGDTVLKPGNPGSSIDVMSIRRQVNEFNAQRHDRDKARVFCVGHVHTGSVVQLPGGVTFVSNGALVPVDPFAQSVGIFDTTSGQQMFESVEGRPFGDSRFVIVDSSTDRDKSLDAVVQPFKGI